MKKTLYHFNLTVWRIRPYLENMPYLVIDQFLSITLFGRYDHIWIPWPYLENMPIFGKWSIFKVKPYFEGMTIFGNNDHIWKTWPYLEIDPFLKSWPYLGYDHIWKTLPYLEKHVLIWKWAHFRYNFYAEHLWYLITVVPLNDISFPTLRLNSNLYTTPLTNFLEKQFFRHILIKTRCIQSAIW